MGSLCSVRDDNMRRVLLGLVALTVAVRTAALLAAPDALRDDWDRYRAVAENLVFRGVFATIEAPTAYRPPLYPLMLVPAVALGPFAKPAIAVLHVALGVGTVLLTWRFGLQAGLGRAAVLGAVLVALDPILVRQSTLVMTETPAAFFAAAGLVALGRAAARPSTMRVAAAGVVVALAALVRPTFLPWLGLCAAGLPWRAAPAGRRLAVAVVFVAAGAAVLAPWTIRNYLRFGRPIVATTHGGYNLLLGNNPYFYEHLRTQPWGTPWFSQDLDRQWLAEMPQGEVAANRRAYELAWQCIRQQPAMFVWSCAVRVGRLFSPLPHQLSPHESRPVRTLRYLIGAWYLLELPLAVVGITAAAGRHRGQSHRASPPVGAPWLWAGLLVAAFVAVHTFYWTDLRMRAPLMPAIATAAAAGVATLAGAIRNPRPCPNVSSPCQPA